ncbi:hypothetical protein TNIN_404261 [Trichonephila inaurata madagascariensis]|uniref:Uncharacterized protein n=1 Tax=Trichonephila inaurata madagascariensis TaxID=2747483 RepID=A0A8X6MBG1_9ARAC|nr:hypothetical protein TNIN_404261 [Trichonephila inaurata madagascariensis]
MLFLLLRRRHCALCSCKRFRGKPMPVNMSWTRSLTFISVSFITMLFGAQVVHEIYKPLSDLHEYVEHERHKVLQLKSNEIK